MEKNRLKVFADELDKIKKNYDLIMRNKKKNKNDNFDDLKNIIDKCNIFESYNLEYLKSLKLLEKEEDFKSHLEKFEGSISFKSMESTFPNIINKISAMHKIRDLIHRIVNLEAITIQQREIELKKIFNKIKSQKLYKLNFQLLPSDNIELYLSNLYQVFGRCILSKIKEYKINELNKYAKKEEQDYDFKLTLEIGKMIDEYKKLGVEKRKEKDKDKEADEKLNEMMEKIKSTIKSNENELTIFKIIHNKNFNKYISGFNRFYTKLNDLLNKKFFAKEELNIYDILLFEQFIFCIGNYDFDKLDDNFIEIWKDSLKETTIEDMKKKLELFNEGLKPEKSINLINNNKDLQMDYDGKIFIIKNIQKYSFNRIIFFLMNRNDITEINNFELIKYLKIQYFSDFIHENILDKKWKTFLYDVFKSNTIQSLINSTYKNIKDITEEDFKKIIDSVKFFNFKCLAYGQSFALYNIFIGGIIRDNEKDPLEQIKYYVRLLIIFMHEILGHILIFLIEILYDKTIESPETKEKKYSKAANSRGRESGEYMHVELFGKLLNKITPKELCFIFDIKNYSENDYKIFTKKFLECENESLVIPDILIELLDNVTINENSEIPLDIYPSKGNIEFSLNIIEGNERICKMVDIHDYNEKDIY